MQPGRDRRRKGQVGVGVGAGNAAFHAQARSVADDAEAARPVVVAPDDRGRCEGARLVALVGVDEGRIEEREIAGQRDQPREVMLEQRRHPVRAAVRGMEERLVALGVPERGVQVERAARLRHRPFRHERHRHLVEGGDFLDAVLVDDVPVRHLQ